MKLTAKMAGALAVATMACTPLAGAAAPLPTPAAASAAAPRARSPLPNVPVPALDLARYAGQWHEVARLPMFFQRQCVGDVTARYTSRPDGTLEVRNGCRTRRGGRDESVGAARRTAQPGALEVRFAPAWLAWAPAVWADYWVVELDPDYRWAVVGGPSRKALWVLSRAPTLDRATFDGIRARAAARGYAVDRLILSGGLTP